MCLSQYNRAMKTTLLRNVAVLAVLLFCSAYINAQTDEDKVYDKTEVDTVPRILPHAKPETNGQCKSNSQGTVIFDAILHRSKTITISKMVKSSGCEAYDQNAQNAAKSARFEPGTKGGKPVSVKMQLRYTYATY